MSEFHEMTLQPLSEITPRQEFVLELGRYLLHVDPETAEPLIERAISHQRRAGVIGDTPLLLPHPYCTFWFSMNGNAFASNTDRSVLVKIHGNDASDKRTVALLIPSGVTLTWPRKLGLVTPGPLSQGAPMDMLTIIRVIAVVCAGLLAGIFLGYRAGPQFALPKLSLSSFVQFQQVVHAHYVRFMPLLNLAALATALAWLVMVRPRWTSVEFWLIAVSTCGIAFIAAITRAVNVPLNNRLMTWSIDAPPNDLWKVWTPWDRVNTIRAFVSTGVLIFEVVALSLTASTGRP